ncbi:MAG: hypothetical protein ACI4SF_12695 [Oscillospiraceae bacterium]
MCRHENDRINSSGCTDITAYEAIKNVRREERRRLIAELKALANKHGYRIVSTIQLKDMDGDYPNDE